MGVGNGLGAETAAQRTDRADVVVISPQSSPRNEPYETSESRPIRGSRWFIHRLPRPD